MASQFHRNVSRGLQRSEEEPQFAQHLKHNGQWRLDYNHYDLPPGLDELQVYVVCDSALKEHAFIKSSLWKALDLMSIRTVDYFNNICGFAKSSVFSTWETCDIMIPTQDRQHSYRHRCSIGC